MAFKESVNVEESVTVGIVNKKDKKSNFNQKEKKKEEVKDDKKDNESRSG